MKAQPAPLTHKLILLTLGVIAGCLAMIAVQLYAPDPDQANGPVATSAGDSLADTIRHRWSTNLANRGLSTNRVATGTASLASHSGGGVPVAAGPGNAERIAGDATPPTGVNEERLAILNRTAVVQGQTQTVPAGASHGILGRVTLAGVPMPEIPIELGPNCGPLQTKPVTTRHYVVSPDGGLANVLVMVLRRTSNEDEIVNDLRGPGILPDALLDASSSLSVHAPALSGRVLLDQRGCMFEPYMLAMQKTQTLVARNSDPVLHNLHFTPRRNQEANFGQPAMGHELEFRFQKSEAFIRIKCDVHPWMFAYVSVLPHPFFALTDTNGYYSIQGGLPPGDYILGAAHLKSGTLLDAKVSLKNGSETTKDFQFKASGYELKSVATGGR